MVITEYSAVLTRFALPRFAAAGDGQGDRVVIPSLRPLSVSKTAILHPEPEPSQIMRALARLGPNLALTCCAWPSLKRRRMLGCLGVLLVCR